MNEVTELTTQSSTGATVYKHLLMGKATERTRKAYANDLRDFASFPRIWYRRRVCAERLDS